MARSGPEGKEQRAHELGEILAEFAAGKLDVRAVGDMADEDIHCVTVHNRLNTIKDMPNQVRSTRRWAKAVGWLSAGATLGAFGWSAHEAVNALADAQTILEVGQAALPQAAAGLATCLVGGKVSRHLNRVAASFVVYGEHLKADLMEEFRQHFQEFELNARARRMQQGGHETRHGKRFRGDPPNDSFARERLRWVDYVQGREKRPPTRLPGHEVFIGDVSVYAGGSVQREVKKANGEVVFKEDPADRVNVDPNMLIEEFGKEMLSACLKETKEAILPSS